MKSIEIRKRFLDYFKSKQHKIVASAPVVLKNDPTLMFTNAGMNQFKDYFLGNQVPDNRRVADTQKCLRVSGKHNDLEEVGVDTYHHTLFEMLGNWSFGDYFKKEAIEYAWEFLTVELKLNKEDLYATVFMGDQEDGLKEDEEAYKEWKKYLPENRILKCSKKDNFWEMGETGPCGPCSEIHIDMRTAKEKAAQNGLELVNEDHPQVVEIWNLVFMQYQRMADKSLVNLPETHVDTGMGFERLAMAMQEKQATYDTDVFMPLIQKVEQITGSKYGIDEKTNIAIRVIVDHIRAIAFTIADGQLPSNTGAGYVIRRILRRAVRYAYSFLDYKQPILFQLLPILSEQMGETFPELPNQITLITKVVQEEEKSFLKTLVEGLKRFNQLESKENVIDGTNAFELYDTYGFPIDLTRLLASEKGLSVDEKGFEKAMKAQKERARKAAKVTKGDWIEIEEGTVEFVGYDVLESTSRVLKYREVEAKGKNYYELVLNQTPFYAESGGQVGDTGILVETDGNEVKIWDTKKENDLIIHFVNELPNQLHIEITAKVTTKRRTQIMANHSVTHLLHSALRIVLGDHVQQRGSLVHPDYMRFDFSHFSKMTAEEIAEVERMVNEKIRENIQLQEDRNVPVKEAMEKGAMALFGEKYGDEVRVITFDKEYSVELCGGTHIPATGQIGLFKITSEGSVAAGIRRIEAVTAQKAENLVSKQQELIKSIKELLKQPKDVLKSVQQLKDENAKLKKDIEALEAMKTAQLKQSLIAEAVEENGVSIICKQMNASDVANVKNLVHDIKAAMENVVVILGLAGEEKAQLIVGVTDELAKAKGIHAGNLIREAAKLINGGGGGQPFYASAGGKAPEKLEEALTFVKEKVNQQLQ